jgi:Flp pilus assembly protein TadG
MRKLNQKGSILIFMTLAFALLGTFIGFAVDFGRAYLQKARISRLVDGAALAAAKALKGQIKFKDDATRAACDSMEMNGAKVAMTGANSCASTISNFSVTLSFPPLPVTGGLPVLSVLVTGTEPMPTTFLRFLGWITPGDFSTINVSAQAQAGPERPIDLMLVLDRSGSMTATDGSGQTKINALKTAVNGFLGLSNTFSADDQIGMVSFSTRGCGDNGQDSLTAGNCTPDVPLKPADASFISQLQGKVNQLVAVGGTNTMEAIRTARGELAPVFDDTDRGPITRKAVLLVTDGQPTFMRADNKTECERDPKSGTSFNNNGPDGCKLGVPTAAGSILRYPLTSSSGTSFNSPNGTSLYLNTIACTRSMTGYCLAGSDGAMHEANLTRNCGYGNSSCGSGGAHEVLFFAIAIGKKDLTKPQQSLDENAKCLLARIANATDILNAATGVLETMADMCNGKFQTNDGDTHNDLVQGWPANCVGGAPCIDGDQQKGKVYIVDVSGNVAAQLEIVFQEIAALLKLRLVL